MAITRRIFLTLPALFRGAALAQDAGNRLYIAARYDQSRVLILLGREKTGNADLPKGEALAAPSAGFIGRDEVFDLSADQIRRWDIDPPLAVGIGDRFEIMPGIAPGLSASVERHVVCAASCETMPAALLRISDAAAASAGFPDLCLARPRRQGTPPAVALTPMQEATLSARERTRIEILLTNAMRQHLREMTRNPQPPLPSEWRSLATGKPVTKFACAVDLVSLGPKYGNRYYAQCAWQRGEGPAYVLGGWVRPGATPVLESLWTLPELESRENLEDSRWLDDAPSILNVVAQADGRVWVFRYTTGHEIGELEVMEYHQGRFVKPVLSWGQASC